MSARDRIVAVLSRHGLRWPNGDIVDDVTVDEHSLVDDLLRISTINVERDLMVSLDEGLVAASVLAQIRKMLDHQQSKSRTLREITAAVRIWEARPDAIRKAPPAFDGEWPTQIPVCRPMADSAELDIVSWPPPPGAANYRFYVRDDAAGGDGAARELAMVWDALVVTGVIDPDAVTFSGSAIADAIRTAPDASQSHHPAQAIYRRLLDLDGLDPSSRYAEMLRVAKVAEEAGEAMQALIAYHGVNPRKARGGLPNLIKELADVALAAEVAIESFGQDAREAVVRRGREVLERLLRIDGAPGEIDPEAAAQLWRETHPETAADGRSTTETATGAQCPICSQPGYPPTRDCRACRGAGTVESEAHALVLRIIASSPWPIEQGHKFPTADREQARLDAYRFVGLEPEAAAATRERPDA